MSDVSVTPQTPARWTRVLGDLARPAEHSVALRVATLAAVMSAAVGVLAQDIAGPAIWIIALCVIPAGAVVSHVRRHDARPLVPALLTLVTLVITVRFLLANGSPASPGELRVPLAELLVTLEGVRSFGLRSRRDLRFALASSVALIAVGGALSLSIAYAGYLAVWGVAAVAALALSHRSELRELAPAPLKPPARARPDVPVRAIVVTAAAVAAIGAAAFLVVPAAKSSRFLAFTARLPSQIAVPTPGGLSNPALGRDNPSRQDGGSSDGGRKSFGYFGFADRLDTSVRGRPDDTLVMRVRSSAPDFWRGQTFDVWDGRVWTMSDERTAVVVSRGGAIQLLSPAAEPAVRGDELVQTYYLETSGPNLIFAANRATQVYIPQAALFQLSDGTVRTGVELDRGAVYTVVSRRSRATASALRAVGDVETQLAPEIATRYTHALSTPNRVAELARTLTAGQPTTYDKVRSIEAWLGQNTMYSLDIPPLPPGADAVEQFLFEDRIGFCEQIASSLVVMLRSQGIPARLAVGYTPGERNPFTGLFEVRARDAHSWAEVYFPGFGWQGFDPTANVPLAGDPQPDAARVGLRDYLSRHLPELSAPVIALLAASAGLAALLMLWRPIRRALERVRRRSRRSWADLQLGRLEQIGRRLGRERRSGETAHEYAGALQRSVLRDPRLGEVADALAEDAFSPEPLDAEERARVEELIGDLAGRA